MTRNRASAKKAGADLEIGQETYWRDSLRQPNIHRGKSQGIHDKGDLLAIELFWENTKVFLGNLTAECKNEATVKLGTWWKEADAERRNNKATVYSETGATDQIPSLAAVIIHKRHGFDVRKQPGKQWATLPVEELIALIRGNRDHITD